MNVAIEQPSQGGNIGGTEEGVKVEGKSRLVKNGYYTNLTNDKKTRIVPQIHYQVSEMRRNHLKRETSVATREQATASYLRSITPLSAQKTTANSFQRRAITDSKIER